MAIDTSLQAQVDAQLMEQGAFAPLELLFNSGRLLYSDYESWRRRQVPLLDGVLMGNREKIAAEIEQAVAYARSIGLVEQPQEFFAWHTPSPAEISADEQPESLSKAHTLSAVSAGGSDKPLRISADAQLQRLIGSRYIPAQNAPQMDLFFDNPVVALANGIVMALTTRNLADAHRQLDRLYAQAPNHSDLAAFDQLLAALGLLGHAGNDPGAELDFLLEVTPTARRLLGAQSRDLLSPLWLQLADTLRGTAYSPDQATLHRSFALSQAQDWAAVSDSVLGEPDWQLHAVLCMRLVESAFCRRRRVEGLLAWCHLCWAAPEHAADAVSRLRQPDLTALWQHFLDSEPDLPVSGHSAEPALSAADFPAWLLLREPGLALQLPADLPVRSSPAQDNYRCVHRWIQARRANRAAEEVALRKTLQASHPILFEVLKQSVRK
ncbi:MAG: hypothetical protein JWM63_1497 [Gammaproteobacteria bacterium]|nr:hypothetical protein [Gammaproteobacteria bacterium]